MFVKNTVTLTHNDIIVILVYLKQVFSNDNVCESLFTLGLVVFSTNVRQYPFRNINMGCLNKTNFDDMGITKTDTVKQFRCVC